MRSAVITIRKIPKYERLQRMASRYPEFDADAVEALIALLSVSARVTEEVQTDLARYQMSTGRFLILDLLLAALPNSVTHSELAEQFGVTKGNITGLVDGLEKDGYVEREAREGDRRVCSIVMTDSGRRVIEGVLPGPLKRITRLMRKLSVSDGRTLMTLLAKVQAGLGKMD